MAFQSKSMWQCPECGHSLRWSLNRSTQPRPSEPSICGHCATFVIFTDELTLRTFDWPDWCLLTHTKKRNLVATRAVIPHQHASRETINAAFCMAATWSLFSRPFYSMR